MEKILAKIEEVKVLMATEYSLANCHIQRKKQWELFDELEKLADEKNTLLGRHIRYFVGDDYAYYIIDKVNKLAVHVSWLGNGDDYSIREFGKTGGTLKREDALRLTGRLNFKK